jgi:hypothetical protein
MPAGTTKCCHQVIYSVYISIAVVCLFCQMPRHCPCLGGLLAAIGQQGGQYQEGALHSTYPWYEEDGKEARQYILTQQILNKDIVYNIKIN